MSRPLDVITLRGLAAEAIHGVLPEEHLAAQPFVVDLRIWLDASEAARSDEIGRTVSYADIAEEVAGILTGEPVRLLETLGQRIAEAILSHERVLGVEVTVHKPRAPIARPFSDVSVTVRRGQIGAPQSSAPETEAELAAPLLPRPAGRRSERDDADAPDSASPTDGSAPEDAVHAVAGADPARTITDPPCEDAAPVRVVLALGGNIGDAPSILARAVESLVDSDRIEVVDVSPLLRTSAVLDEGQEPQEDYWNAVVLARTRLDPHGVLELARALESDAGRVRVEHWGPRTLDVDLIDYDGLSFEDEELSLPHPRAAERAFVLAPWLMVDEDARLGGRSVAELLGRAPDARGIIDAVDDWLLDAGSVKAESDALLARGRREAPEHEHPEDFGALSPEAEPPAHPDAAGAVSAGIAPLSDPAPAPEERTTRLDFMPDASREGLAPSAAGEDLVWRRLWERWSRPMSVEELEALAAPADDAGAQIGSEPSPEAQPQSPAGRSPAEESQPRAGEAQGAAESAPSGIASAEDPADSALEPAPLVTSAEAAPAGPEAADEPTAPEEVAEAREETAARAGEPGPRPDEAPRPEAEAPAVEERRPRPRWFPLLGRSESKKDARENRSRREDAGRTAPSSQPDAQETPTDPAPVPEAPEDPAPQRHEAHRGLPSWDFGRGDLRIVDEPGAVTIDVETDAPRTAPRRSIVDPGLPPDALRGPVADTETTTTGVLRKVVVRPSTTGQIPIFKDRDR